MDVPAQPQPHPLPPWTKLVGLNEANANANATAKATANANNYLPQSMPKGECQLNCQLNAPSLSAYGNTMVPYQGSTCGQVTQGVPDLAQREPKELFSNHCQLLGYHHNTGLSPGPSQGSVLGLGPVTSLGMCQSPEPVISSSQGLEKSPKPGVDSILTTSKASLLSHGQHQGQGQNLGNGNCNGNCNGNGYSHSHENSTNEVPVPAPVPAQALVPVHEYVHRIELMHGKSREQLFSHLSSNERYQLFIELYKSYGRMAAIGLAPVALKVSKVS